MDMSFCRRCKEPLQYIALNKYKCNNNHTIYLASSPAVGILFVNEVKNVLLARRGVQPHKGMLDSVGGFVDGEETYEIAAIRELKEETGITTIGQSDLQYLTSAIGHYPYENEVIPVLTTYFWAHLPAATILNASDDVASLEWFPLGSVNLAELHDDDTRAAVTALQQILL